MKRLRWILPWLLLLVAVADWLGLKNGVIQHTPWVLGVLVGTAVLGFVLRLFHVVKRLVGRKERRWSALGEALVIIGVLTALGGGLANWLLSVQGYVILREGDAVPLHGGSHLQQFDAGPLARIEEMQFTLALSSLELVPAGGEHYYPESSLVVQEAGQDPVSLSVSPRSAGSFANLRLYQGAFGFAPRIVLVEDERTIFDEVVPFTTERRGPTGISFRGIFTIARERLEIEGAVDLANLDEGMRGHATLQLEIRREGELLGRGRLLPGHFAEIGEDYRVGFAGLEKWSEIDISRRHYGHVVKLGAALILFGAILWPLAVWGKR